MPDRQVAVSLEATGAEITRCHGLFADFTLARRARRAVIVLLGATGLAALFLPIPIIHLLAIPMILLGGIVTAIRQLSVVGRLAPLRMACPKCGVRNRVGGGLGVRSVAPKSRVCESCRRELILRIEPIVGLITPAR